MKEITQIWMIRSGEQGYLFEDFLSKKVVAIGWNDIGDLAHIKKPEEIKLRLRKAYPDHRQGQIDNIAGQMNRFSEVVLFIRTVRYANFDLKLGNTSVQTAQG